MVPNPAIRNLIREDKIHQIYSQQQIGQEKYQMQTLNQSLADLYLRKQITYEDALNKSQDPDELKRIITAPGILVQLQEGRKNREYLERKSYF